MYKSVKKWKWLTAAITQNLNCCRRWTGGVLGLRLLKWWWGTNPFIMMTIGIIQHSISKYLAFEKRCDVSFNGIKLSVHIWKLWRNNFRERNKKQVEPWPQCLNKQIYAGQQLNVRGREGNGSKSWKTCMYNMYLLPYLLYDLPRRSPCKFDIDQTTYSTFERHCNH